MKQFYFKAAGRPALMLLCILAPLSCYVFRLLQVAGIRSNKREESSLPQHPAGCRKSPTGSMSLSGNRDLFKIAAFVTAAVFFYFLIDNVWWVYVFEGTYLLDVYPD